MADKEIRFNTVEDMVAYVTAHPYDKDTRWKLEDRSELVYQDKVAGAAWESEYETVYNAVRVAHNLEDWQYLPEEKLTKKEAKALEELVSRQPKKITNVWYYLAEISDSSWRNRYIHLSVELGDEIAACWTVKESRWGSRMERVGRLTMAGILKRLGKSEIADLVKAAVEAEAARSAKNARNSARRQAATLAKDLIALMKKNPEIVWPAQLSELAAMVEEQ